MPRPEFNKYPCHTHNLRISQISCLIPNSTPMPRPGIIVNYEQHQYIYKLLFFPKNKLKNVKKIFFFTKNNKILNLRFRNKTKNTIIPRGFFRFFSIKNHPKIPIQFNFHKTKASKVQSLSTWLVSVPTLFHININLKIPKLSPNCL
jgi:hypothetical protein